jgi:hypothetical protein
MHADLPPKSDSRTSQLRDQSSRTWKGKVTLIDLKWFRQVDALRRDHFFDVVNDPFEFAQVVSSASIPTELKRPEQLFDYIARFSLDVASSLANIRNRMKVDFYLTTSSAFLRASNAAYGMTETHRIRSNMIASIPVTSREIDEQPCSCGALTSHIDYTGPGLLHYLFTLPVPRRKSSSFA